MLIFYVDDHAPWSVLTSPEPIIITIDGEYIEAICILATLPVGRVT